MTTYLGFDVLDATDHNMRDSIKHAFTRQGVLYGGRTGRRGWDDFAGQPTSLRNFSYFASGRTAIGVMRAFIDARRGRWKPFWVPTYGAEVPLLPSNYPTQPPTALCAASGDSVLTVASVGYSRYLFPVIARRYLAITRPPGGPFTIVKVTGATDNGNGSETLNLAAALTEDVPVTRLVSFLALCRLETDDIEIAWSGTTFAEAVLPVREVPTEVPA